MLQDTNVKDDKILKGRQVAKKIGELLLTISEIYTEIINELSH